MHRAPIGRRPDWSLRHATPASSCWTMSPILYERFTFTINLQGTPPRTRTLTNWVGTSHAANYTRDAQFSAEGVRLELTSRDRDHLFSRQAPHPAGCLPFVSCGGRNRTCVRTVQSRQPVPAQAPPHRLFETRSSRQARGEGFEPSPPGSKTGGLPLADPRSQGVPCGSRTHLASLEGWNLCRSAKSTC